MLLLISIIATTSISNVSNSIIVISAHLVSEERLEPPTVMQYSVYIIAQTKIFVNFSKHISEHILKHFCKILGLFIVRKLLFCNKAAPFVADLVFVLSEMFQTLLVVLLADKDGLTKRSILHKTAHKQDPFAVVHLILF